MPEVPVPPVPEPDVPEPDVPEPRVPEPVLPEPLVPEPLVPVRLELLSLELPWILEPAGRASPVLCWPDPARVSMGRPADWATVLMWAACCWRWGRVWVAHCLIS